VRSVPATLVAFVLLLMLSVTTPTGTGDGVHESVLLHPLFSHTHLIGGRLVTHNQMASAASTTSSEPSKGPAIGAEAGAAAAVGGLAISPTVPLQDLRLSVTAPHTYPIPRFEQPRGLVTAPPDPPPTFGA
jgi:hypothetical protein